MSVSHRSIGRLPISIFSDLAGCPIEEMNSNSDSFEERSIISLRSQICNKLLRYYHPDNSAITVGNLLQLPTHTLMNILDPLLTYRECEELIRRVCELCSPVPVTAMELLLRCSSTTTTTTSTTMMMGNNNDDEENSPYGRIKRKSNVIGTGMSILDNHLKGGFRLGQISEIVGRAGVGKTQLALQLCIQSAIAGIPSRNHNTVTNSSRATRHSRGCSIYIDTEKKMSLQRLQQMTMEQLSHQTNRSNEMITSENNEHDTEYLDTLSLQEQLKLQQQQVLDSVTVHSIHSMTELLTFVSQHLEEEILFRNNNNDDDNDEGDNAPAVSLIVLDSIAAPVKRDFDSSSSLSHHSRVSILFQIAQRLKRIADQLQVAVVIINQIDHVLSGPLLNTTFENENKLNNCNNKEEVKQREGSDFVQVQAALGTSWHHCITTRLLLEHERDPHRIETATDIAHNRAQNENRMDDKLSKPNNTTTAPAWLSERGHIRTATIIKSNLTGRHTMSYQITSRGICQT